MIWNLEFTAMKRTGAGNMEAQRFQQSGDALFTIESLDILIGDETVTRIELRREGADEGFKSGPMETVDDEGAPRTPQEQVAAMFGYPYP